MSEKNARYEKLIHLINLWQDFEKEKTGTIELEEFAIWMLTKATTQKPVFANKLKNTNNIPLEAVINVLLLRSAKFIEQQMKPVFAESPITFTDYRILACVDSRKNPRKIEVITEVMLETTTATAIMKNLIGEDLLSEAQDALDKRSKRLTITKKGQTVFFQKRLEVIALLPGMFAVLSLEEKQQLVDLLTSVDRFFANL